MQRRKYKLNANKYKDTNIKLDLNNNSLKKKVRNIKNQKNQYSNNPFNKNKNLIKSYNHQKSSIFNQVSLNILNSNNMNNNSNFAFHDSYNNKIKENNNEMKSKPIKIQDENIESINDNNYRKDYTERNGRENELENKLGIGNVKNEIRNIYDKRYSCEEDLNFNIIHIDNDEKDSDNNNKEVKNLNYILNDEKEDDSKKISNNNENQIDYIEVIDDENLIVKDNKKDKEYINKIEKKNSFNEDEIKAISIDDEDIKDKKKNKKKHYYKDNNDEDIYNNCHYIIND